MSNAATLPGLKMVVNRDQQRIADEITK